LKQNWLKSSCQKFLTEVLSKDFGNDNQLKITTKYKVQDHGTEADEEVNKILFQALKSYYSADLTYDKFVNSMMVRNLELFKHRRLDLLC
jgi:SecD/SecF fusion protein